MEVFFSPVGGKLEKQNILSRIAKLFGAEDDNLSVGPHILCMFFNALLLLYVLNSILGF